ncbi:muconolactone Delta-isomerase family protein [Streptomyces sp. NPDC046821]|uniref:muconolactone Delta-isomerase family protein n=1 Tax=Streptomyces sp. NPDC046821 TaxID=3154702 RepID=UPI0033FA6339
MKDFLVEITTDVPQDVSAEEVERRRATESVRARELATAGRLFRLWRPVGEKRSIGIWRAEDEERLRTDVLGTLPLWPWMTAVVTPLEPHPNDPGTPA